MKGTVFQLPALSCETKQADDLLSYLKLKAKQTFFAIRKKPVIGSFDTLVAAAVVKSLFNFIGFWLGDKKIRR